MVKAVIFDYGMVLSGPRAQWAIDAALALTGLHSARFEEVYWKFRDAYDAGALDGTAYWRQSLEDAGISAAPATIAELVALDGVMWCTANAVLIAWQQRLRAAGVKTAILSNMGGTVRAAIERECAWVHTLDVRVWSHEVGCTKPDRRIYKHALDRLGVDPGEALFLDDRAENVLAARQYGMHALAFSTADQLREDLHTAVPLAALPPV